MKKKAIRQSVPIAERNVKSHSSPTEADRYTAENAIQKEALQDEDSKPS